MSESSGSARIGVALAVICAVASLAVALSHSGGAAGDAALEAPDLPRFARACDAAAGATLRRAVEAEAAAEVKIARYPYAPAEGLAALALLALAQSCYAASVAAADQVRAAARAEAWRTQLERDYQAQLIRRERALALGDARAARAAATFLLELLAGEQGPFIARLRRAQFETEAGATEELP